VAALDGNVQEIRKYIASDATLLNMGRISTHEYWVHTLVRRSFSLSDINGEVAGARSALQAPTHALRASDGSAHLDVPASWEKCGVYIQGAPGATFKFYEYPDAAEIPV